MNSLTVVGKVGKDAVLRHAGDKPVLSFSVASDAGWGDRKKTTWLDCSLWGKRGESLAKNILKGDKILVIGEMSTREHDGKTYVTLDVKEVELLGGKREDSQPSSRQQERNSSEAGFDDGEIPF